MLVVSVASGVGMTNAIELPTDSGSLYSWEEIEAKGLLVGRKK